MPPQTTYLPSAKRARVMTMNIGALILRHKDELSAHDDIIERHRTELDQHDAILSRGFFGRLSWLLRGK